MRFLPLQYRETQSDLLGKKGISWHISRLNTKKNDHKRTGSISLEHLDLITYICILKIRLVFLCLFYQEPSFNSMNAVSKTCTGLHKDRQCQLLSEYTTHFLFQSESESFSYFHPITIKQFYFGEAQAEKQSLLRQKLVPVKCMLLVSK